MTLSPYNANPRKRTHTNLAKNLNSLNGDFFELHSGNNRLWFPVESEYLQQIFFLISGGSAWIKPRNFVATIFFQVLIQSLFTSQLLMWSKTSQSVYWSSYETKIEEIVFRILAWSGDFSLFQSVQTSSGTHPISCSIDRWFPFLWGEKAREWS
jgi:hypothetical protein